MAVSQYGTCEGRVATSERLFQSRVSEESLPDKQRISDHLSTSSHFPSEHCDATFTIIKLGQ